MLGNVEATDDIRSLDGGLSAPDDSGKQRNKPPPHLVRGPLALNVRSGDLRGPAGAMQLSFGRLILLAALMPRDIVMEAALLDVEFPPGTRQPATPQHALRVQIMRIRAALERVGVPGATLRNWHGLGYGLMLPRASAYRVFEGPKVALLEMLLATHPNQSAVARLDEGDPITQ